VATHRVSFEGDDEKPGHTKDIIACFAKSFVSFAVRALNRKGRRAYAKGAK